MGDAMRTELSARKAMPSPRERLRAMAPSLVVNVVVSVFAYSLARPHVDSDTAALAIAGAIPALWTVAMLAWTRRLDPIGLLATTGFAIALIVTVVAGGRSLL